MCGICGILVKSGEQTDSELLWRMCASLNHRGPDGQNCFIQKHVGLGHTRLSIIDVAGGGQPLFNEDKSVSIVFNGEIFNYQELAKQLQSKGHIFQTHCDTEVIVHLYEEYGTDCLQYLNGQFAFGIWDFNKQQLFLARDRVGIKSLYYYASTSEIVFASELKALLLHPKIPKNICPQALDYYFTYFYIPSPLTIYEKICKLPPAHYLVWREGRWEEKQYWTVANGLPQTASWAEALQLFEKKLEQATVSQLMSEVPLGAFLSGGIDSSTIAYFMQKNSTTPVHTFSIQFPNTSEDETQYALEVASYLKTKHEVLPVTPDYQQTDEIVRLLRQFDEPFGDTSAIPTYFLCKLARQKVKVCLSGDGGDELLGGYSRYLALCRQSKFDRWPGIVKKIAWHASKFFPHASFAKRWKSVALTTAERYLQHVTFTNPALRANLFAQPLRQSLLAMPEAQAAEAYMTRFFAGKPLDEQLSQMLYADFHTYLPELVLTKVDRMAMMSSLEVRVPFLDHEVAELLFSLPLAFKIHKNSGKHLLKKIMADKLPQTIVERKKKGFGLPLRYWFSQGFDAFAREIISNRRCVQAGILDKAFVEKVCLTSEPKRRDEKLIWAVLVLEIWLSGANFSE